MLSRILEAALRQERLELEKQRREQEAKERLEQEKQKKEQEAIQRLEDAKKREEKAKTSLKAAQQAKQEKVVQQANNLDGSVLGIFSGSKTFADGEAITTSPLQGEPAAGSVAATQTGSL